MSELDILFPISEGNRNADDMGIPVVRDILEVLHDSDLGGTRFGPMLHDAIAEIKNLRLQLEYQKRRADVNFDALKDARGEIF